MDSVQQQEKQEQQQHSRGFDLHLRGVGYAKDFATSQITWDYLEMTWNYLEMTWDYIEILMPPQYVQGMDIHKNNQIFDQHHFIVAKHMTS